jgi:RNA polymerase subunit RPABC4/transcription elongation factor Spt4|tara:strand:+ start:40 stop:549 length:510 start_codon:yes stop_codon:yes gene_type:complete
MSTQSILGLFQQPELAADAMDGLKEAGFELGTFDVLTGTPYPEGAFGEYVPQHRLFRFPAFGAIIGLTLSIFLTAITQLAYPIVTGGKPILSIFAMLIIMYEMTMLSGVIATVIGIVFESRLPNMKPGIYDTRITEGWIGVVITFDDDSKIAEAQNVLNKAGALEIKTA